MAEFKSEFLHELMGGNENFSEEEFRTRLREYLEQEERATAPADAAPMEMFMSSTAPELRGRKNLAMFLQHFHTWASVAGCNSALDSDVTVKPCGIPRAELERLHNRTLVQKSLQVWQSLTKAL